MACRGVTSQFAATVLGLRPESCSTTLASPRTVAVSTGPGIIPPLLNQVLGNQDVADAVKRFRTTVRSSQSASWMHALGFVDQLVSVEAGERACSPALNHPGTCRAPYPHLAA
jgi:hypothetical protein